MVPAQQESIRERGESRGREGGYVLIAVAPALVAVMGMSALAVDLGRMYVAKNETQSYADAAALAAALELNGTLNGFENARQAVASSTNRWNFGNSTFSGTLVQFSQSATGPWESAPASAANYRFVKVTAGVDVPLSFARVIASGATRRVQAEAVAGQLEKTGFSSGLFPFSPLAHDDNPDDNYGLVPGGIYTLRWAANPRLSNSNSLCPGDRDQGVIDRHKAGGAQERGYIEETSASVIRKAILGDYRSTYKQIGDSVVMTGGAKQTERDALAARVRQDTNVTANTFAEYFNGGTPTGNGRRLVAAPINLGAPGGYKIVQIAAFYLLNPEDYLSARGGNRPLCAGYVGSYVEGASGPGAGPPG